MQLNSSRTPLAIPVLVLPSEFRRALALPQGALYVEPTRGEVRGLSAVVSVGDVVSARHSAVIRVVDYKSERRPHAGSYAVSTSECRVVVNPPGTLSLNTITTISGVERGCIRVVGEEDLLVIPFLARRGISIIYGQPGVGAVKLKSDLNIALKMLKILKPSIVTYSVGGVYE